MDTARTFAFALAVIPYLNYLVGVTFLSIGTWRTADSKGDRRVGWQFNAFAVLALALAVWQQSQLSALFGDWPSNVSSNSTRVLGVDIPRELDSVTRDFVGSVFWLLVQMVLISTCVVGLFRPPRNSPLPKGVSKVVLVAFIVLLVWIGWFELASVLEGWQRLF